MRELSERRLGLIESSHSDRGFSFIEVVIAMALTTIVMGVVFSLLVNSIQSTPAGFERSDLQAQARHALKTLSDDVLLAGTDLPLEFPAFTPPGVNPALDRGHDEPDSFEIVGHLSQDASGIGPMRVVSFDGQTALLETAPLQVERGDLVLLYDDEPIHGTWMFGIVSAVHRSPQPALTLVTGPGDAVEDLRLPPFIGNYNRNQPRSGFVTPVTVVTYMVDFDSAVETLEPERVLWRQVNWGPPSQVAFVEDLEIRFFVGGTVPPSPGYDERRRVTPFAVASLKHGRELEYPPVPQPNRAKRLHPDSLVRGVGIHITSRSHQADLLGSTTPPDRNADEDGYLRVTYSTRVATRNLLFQLHEKQHLGGFN